MKNQIIIKRTDSGKFKGMVLYNNKPYYETPETNTLTAAQKLVTEFINKQTPVSRNASKTTTAINYPAPTTPIPSRPVATQPVRKCCGRR